MSDYVKIGLETGDYGSGSGTAYAAKVTSSEQNIERGVTYETTIDNFVYNSAAGGALKLSGTLEGKLRPRQLELLFHSLFGSVTDMTTYNLYELSDTPVPLILQVGDITDGASGYQTNYKGVGISSISLTMEAKEYVTLSADWIARDFEKVAYSKPGSGDYITEKPIVFWRAGITLGGDTALIKSMNLDITGNLDDEEFYLNDFKLGRLIRSGVFDIGGDITFSEREYEEIARMMTGSTTGTSVGATNPLGNVAIVVTLLYEDGSSAMTISMPAAIEESGGSSRSERDQVEKTVTYKVTEDITVSIY